MRITARLIFALAVAIALVAAIFTYWQVHQERARQEEEFERRARFLAESIEEAIDPLLSSGTAQGLDEIVESFGRRGRVDAIVVYDAQGIRLAASSGLADPPRAEPEALRTARDRDVSVSGFDGIDGRAVHVDVSPLGSPGARTGYLVLFQDASHAAARLAAIWRNSFLRVLVQMVVIAIVTLLVVRWSVVGPIATMAEWMKRLRAGETAGPLSISPRDVFAPMAREVSTFARHLFEARSSAEEEARLRLSADSRWTPERLKEFVRARLGGKPLLVVSNREPYMHLRKGRGIECIVPAGGVVTALDPVLRATGGVWIAHGSGDADWEAADAKGRLGVPPEDPRYTLRRVALSQEEEAGYYYGLANEGLWPLCHNAHVRPQFRPDDWAQYQEVNARFARTVLEEIEGLEDPCILVQDYHFALLPRLVREARPDARVALFWHIPWPNPEAFSICPWQKELLQGMLGADILGFHIQFHCNNFLETVDRTLECRIDWEHFAVVKEDRTTLVRRYPISVAFPADDTPVVPDRAALLKGLGVEAEFLAVGVDRLDYTKGILERFAAVERLLDRHAAYRGRCTLVQVGAPSRTQIPRYHEFLAEVEREADRINARFQTGRWRPIVLLPRHHSADEIRPLYQHADVCLVTSLHDGMNLVAKEFVAARSDEGGVLVLSRFTGAARELRDALLVNPYDVEETAEALRRAFEMDPAERQARMRRMRTTVRENNVFRWAGNLITDLAGVHRT